MKISSDILWQNTLPSIDTPFNGESLIGFLLRLDHINRFAPGTVIKQYLKILSLKKFDCVNDLKVLESSVNTEVLSKFLCVSQDQIKSLLLGSVRKNIYGYNNIDTKGLFDYGKLRICPKCIYEWRIPKTFLLKNTDTCLIHGLKLVDRCKCNHKINLFSKNFSCQSCNTSFKDLSEKQLLDAKKMNEKIFYQQVCENILMREFSLPGNKTDLISILKRKISFILSAKEEAIACIKRTLPIIIDTFEVSNIDTQSYLDISQLSLLLCEFQMLPYQFININFDENYSLESQVIDLNIRNNVNLCNDDLSKYFDLHDELINIGNVITSSSTIANVLNVLFNNTSEIHGKVEVKSKFTSFIFEFLITKKLNSLTVFKLENFKTCMTLIL